MQGRTAWSKWRVTWTTEFHLMTTKLKSGRHHNGYLQIPMSMSMASGLQDAEVGRSLPKLTSHVQYPGIRSRRGGIKGKEYLISVLSSHGNRISDTSPASSPVHILSLAIKASVVVWMRTVLPMGSHLFVYLIPIWWNWEDYGTLRRYSISGESALLGELLRIAPLPVCALFLVCSWRCGPLACCSALGHAVLSQQDNSSWYSI